MILHLLSDKDFHQQIINQFEEVHSSKNIYILFDNEQIKTLKNKNKSLSIYLSTDLNIFNKYKIEAIIVHCMNYNSARYIIKLDKNYPIFWSIFGIDLYNYHPKYFHLLYDNINMKFVFKGKPLPKYLYILKYYIHYYFSENKKTIRKAIGKVSFYSTVIPYETKFAKKIIPKSARYLRLNVGYINDIGNKIKTIKSQSIKEKIHIYIGNSASLTSNHIEVLSILKKMDLSNFNITIQLAYGQNAEYTKYLIDYLNYFPTSSINIIKEWLPIEEFTNILNKQNIFIFNTIRQQGCYAIINGLWSGGKVYLNKKNVTYNYFKSLGVNIFNVQENLSLSNLLSELSEEDIRNNQRIIELEYSKSAIDERTKKVISELSNSYMNY